LPSPLRRRRPRLALPGYSEKKYFPALTREKRRNSPAFYRRFFKERIAVRSSAKLTTNPGRNL
jgi:hypothetical protein